ncbi:MAG: hypothetical protein M1839_007791 [Geoglossum umbratile]|nr:MAG: hypothetical protein M1839_007791 [Geoglossum umbratile]
MVENNPRCRDTIQPYTRADKATTFDRDAVVHDLSNLFALWVKKHAAEHKGMNRLSKDPFRFRRACNKLWQFNREFYETRPIVEQIQNEQSLGIRKREWLYDLFKQSQERLHDLQQLIYFLEALVEDRWDDIPLSETESATIHALFWGKVTPMTRLPTSLLTFLAASAQDAAIATGPHLVHRLYRMDDRPIRRRDFMIGRVYLQGHTIQSLIEEILTAEED